MIWTAVAFAGEISVWHSWRGEERAAFEALAAEWSEGHDRVEPIFVPNESLASKIETAVPRGNGPDLFVFAHERIVDWARLGIILPAEALPDMAPVATEALRHEGRVWGWPLSTKCLALFRNTALVPEAPTTTDALIRVASELRAQDRWGFAYEVTSAYQNAAWMHAFGGGVFAGDRVVLDRPQNVRAFGFIQRLAQDVVPPDPTGALVTQLFNEGRVGMVINGPWFLGEVGDVPFAVSPLPVLSETGEPAAPYVTVESIFLAREKPEARAFAAWLAGPEAARVRADQGKEVVAARIPVTDPVLAAFAAQLEHAVPMPTHPDMAKSWEPLARALRRLVRGASTPELAAAEAATDFAIVSRPPAPPADPSPWIVVGALGLLSALVLSLRAGVRERAWTWSWVLPWIGPAFLSMTLLVLLPFVVGASVSLFEYDGANWSFVGLAHFFDILFARDFPLQSPLSFWSTLLVTVLWTVSNVALHAGLGVALAMLLREPWVRMRGLFRALLILPWAIPNYITALVWKGMFHRQFGAINAVLAAVGAEPVSWFGQFSTAFSANLVTNTWLGFPFMMVVTLGALQSIPRDLEEAAEVDGASWWQRFRHVTLPLLRPALLPAVVLGSVWTFNQFNVVYLVSGGEPDGTTDILVSQVYRWAFTRGHRYGYAAAYAMIIFGVLVLYGRLTRRLVGKAA